MSHRAAQPDYRHLTANLAGTDPSEVHGLLCGLLSTEHDLNDAVWLDRAVGAAGAPAAAAAELRRLRQMTVEQLEDDNLSFTLLLPGDDSTWQVRIAALGAWCEAYLSGLDLGRLRQTSLDEEVLEFLGDVGEIARVGFDPDSDDEGNEEAYSEIVEYLRIGTITVYQELSNPPTLH